MFTVTLLQKKGLPGLYPKCSTLSAFTAATSPNHTTGTTLFGFLSLFPCLLITNLPASFFFLSPFSIVFLFFFLLSPFSITPFPLPSLRFLLSLYNSSFKSSRCTTTEALVEPLLMLQAKNTPKALWFPLLEPMTLRGLVRPRRSKRLSVVVPLCETMPLCVACPAKSLGWRIQLRLSNCVRGSRTMVLRLCVSSPNLVTEEAIC